MHQPQWRSINETVSSRIRGWKINGLNVRTRCLCKNVKENLRFDLITYLFSARIVYICCTLRLQHRAKTVCYQKRRRRRFRFASVSDEALLWNALALCRRDGASFRDFSVQRDMSLRSLSLVRFNSCLPMVAFVCCSLELWYHYYHYCYTRKTYERKKQRFFFKILLNIHLL